MSLCSCSCPIAIFVPVNVGHEHSLMMAQSLSWVEKHSCDNSRLSGKAAEMPEFFQLPSHELQGSFWQLKWFAVENSALREIVEIFRSWVAWYVNLHRLAWGENCVGAGLGLGCCRAILSHYLFSCLTAWCSKKLIFWVLRVPCLLVNPCSSYNMTLLELSVLGNDFVLPLPGQLSLYFCIWH